MSPHETHVRRRFLTVAGASLLLAACHRDGEAPKAKDKGDEDEDKGEDVSATEDLMREHGVIRRIIVVYRESAARLLEASASSFPADALQRAAQLMRTFGEDYHEKQLEEAHIFPAVKQGGGAAAGEVDILLTQHQRGRDITEYVLSSTRGGIASGNAQPLARALLSFARMYEEHTAREDTIVFPRWKKLLSPKQLDAMGDQFEKIEHDTFGKDGFDDGVDKIAAIEKLIGLDPSSLTAEDPPRM